MIPLDTSKGKEVTIDVEDSLDGLVDLLIKEVAAQGHGAWISKSGVRVFQIGDEMIFVPETPRDLPQWRRLLYQLIAAGLRWPPPRGE
ncbi:hypothetical protein GCM10023170_010710 [Phytohabitans houttuyneae]